MITLPNMTLRLVSDSSVMVPYSRVDNSGKAAKVAHALIGDRPVEHLIAMLLDSRGNLTGFVTLATGGMHGVGCRVPDVLRAVLSGQASGFVLSHNHPGGDPTPSREDISFTRIVAAAAKSIDLPMVDHVIVTRDPDQWSAVPVDQ